MRRQATSCRAARLLALLLFSAASSAAAIEVADDLGRSVTLTQPAARVVSLSPHATELIAAAGGLSHLVGVDSASDYPPAVRSLPSVGSGIQYSNERMLVAQPDLLVTWQPGHTRQLPPQTAAFVSTPHTLADLPATVRKLGQLMGTSTTAEPAADVMDARLAALTPHAARAAPIPVFIQIGQPPYYTVNGQHILSDLLRRCGARNVYDDAQAASPRISVEAVLAAAPAVILSATPDGPETIPPALAALPRIQVDASVLFRPGPRLLDAAEQVCAALDAIDAAS